MKTFTIDDVNAFKPCYDAAKYGEKGKQYNILDVLMHKDIPAIDKLWVATQPKMLSEKTLRLFAVAVAREVQHLMKDPRSRKALDVAERYALGQATEEELKSARLDAADASIYAVTSNYDSDTYAAAYAAYTAAAYAAYTAAAYAAASSAASAYAAADYAAAHDYINTSKFVRMKQIEILIRLVKNEVEL